LPKRVAHAAGHGEGCGQATSKKGEAGEKGLRAEAKQIIAEGRPQASEYRDRHGNLRLGLIPEATQTTQPRELQALKLGGFNIRRFPRANYEDALQPPEYAQ